MSLFDRFIGIPYLDRGRSLAGVDCYGLVRLVYRELRGIDLPSYIERYVMGADLAAIESLIAGALDRWALIEQSSETAFDAVLLREGAHPTHIGMVVTPGKMLHVPRGETSRIERYRAGRWQHRIAGFYRYS